MCNQSDFLACVVFGVGDEMTIEDAFKSLYVWLDTHPTYAVHIETVNIKTGRLHDVILWGMDEEPVYDARAEDLPLAIYRVLLSTRSKNENTE